MLLNSRPIRFLITRLARAYGFLDPVALMASMRGFAQPSEVAEPIELLRAGMLFHARGLINTKAIQNNLDWVWPYWVERQFNPADPSFIPRAFSFSHINLTHRNWTAVGQPDIPFYPIVDPRGLVTPLFDGWSLDFWLVPENEVPLLPSKLADMEQHLTFEEDNLHVRSIARRGALALHVDAYLCLLSSQPHCCLQLRAEGMAAGAVAVAVRPYNPEGVSFIEKLSALPDGSGWRINGRHEVTFDQKPERHLFSTYAEGDVALRLKEASTPQSVACPVNMATSVALFPVANLRGGTLQVRAPIYDELDPKHRPSFSATQPWSDAMAPLGKLEVADPTIQRLFDLARLNVVLHAPKEVYPGPYTYKRFWFRDAVFVLNALLSLGDVARTRRALAEFAPRQKRGYFLSQEGEWDSNGEALWFYHRFVALTGEKLPDEWLEAVERGAKWIQRKRLPKDSGKPEAGLLPAGFSAEHLGPNDFYYWDDFWAVAGLRCAAELLRPTRPERAGEFAREADEFLDTIRRSFPAGAERRFPGSIPASPLRRMDAGAVGSLVADYPLQLFAPGDSWVLGTANYLCDHSLYDGGFFQNMIHSGINAYLTLHLAQVRLRAGDPEAAWALMDTVARLASPTGQWPEAIHPHTGGGCMGDGQHIWAASEWLMFVRNLFVREEGAALVIGAGVRPEWLKAGACSLGPTLTPHGAVTTQFARTSNGVNVRVDGTWRTVPPVRDVRLPGCAPVTIPGGDARTEFLVPFKS